MAFPIIFQVLFDNRGLKREQTISRWFFLRYPMRVYDGPLISTPQLGMEFLSLAVSSAPTHFAMPRGVTCFYSVMNGNVVFSGPVSSDWLFWHLFRHIPSLISDHFQSAINIFGYRMKTHAFLKLFPIVWGRNACMEELYSTLLQWSG